MANTPRSTTLAVFQDRNAAEQAMDELLQMGFTSDQVGFVIRGSDALQGGMITDAQGTKDRKGALTGAVTGGTIGAILGAAAALVIPGVGPVLAGGILAAAFGGAIAGTAVGGIFGAMKGLDVSEEEAKFYEREFSEGRAIVAVKAGARSHEAASVLQHHGGYNIETRRNSPVPTEGIFSEP